MRNEPHILMMIESSRESGRQLISGIGDYARHFGPWNFDWKPQGFSHFTTPLEEMQLDGALVRDVADVQPLVDAGVPVVSFMYGRRRVPGTVGVKTDDAALSKKVADHFIQRGFRHFAFAGYEEMPWAAIRGRGFSDVLEAAGFQVDVHWIPVNEGEPDADDVVQWLASQPRPLALMAANDDIGRWIVQLCRESGVRVPEDCAVVGVDNDPVVCGVSNPPLSSVSVDQYQSGYRAAAVLDKMMHGEVPEKQVISAEVSELVVRQSSDIFAIEDEAVAKALRFIQENAHRPMKVDEVASASGVYRRGLERRFRKHSSRTILQYCREARVEYLEKILKESRLGLEDIAEHCGFPEASHLTRFYISMRGEAPSSYRKRISQT